MAETFVRKNAQPTAGTRTDLYTAAGTRNIVVTLNASSPNADTFGISIAPAGAAYNQNQDLVPDTMPINGPNVYQVTAGFTLLSGDIVRVRSGGGNVTFWAFIDEIT